MDPVTALREVSFWLERSRAKQYRSKAYRAAAEAVARLSENDVQLLVASGDLQSVPGIGKSTAAVISQAVAGQTPETLRQLRAAGSALLDVDAAPIRSRLRGDLHSHTTWSDGGSSLVEMVQTAQRLGHEYLAITDHSPRLRVANGLSPERVRAQWQQISEVQSSSEVRILRGVEVDILADGSLDQNTEILDGMDIVVASVHSDLRATTEVMTPRMVRAIAHPRTTVLGHCTGRRIEGQHGTRPPSSFDAELAFEACRHFGVAVEINSRPERQDPPDDLLALAVEMGCLFSIDTDAHAPGQLDFLDLGAGRALRAGVDPKTIINTWSVKELLDHASRHQSV